MSEEGTTGSEVFTNVYIARIKGDEGSKTAWEHILAHYEHMRTENVRPLLVTRTEDNGETRLTVEARGSTDMADLLLEHFSGIEGVDEIQLVNVMKPYFYPIPPGSSELNRFTLFFACDPTLAKETYEKLVSLQVAQGVVPSTLALTFGNKTHNMLLSFLARDRETLNAYLVQHVYSLSGVSETSVAEIKMAKKLSDRFEWKRTVLPITTWEALTGRDYDDKVYRDVNQGC
jgi:hypothetical protein